MKRTRRCWPTRRQPGLGALLGWLLMAGPMAWSQALPQAPAALAHPVRPTPGNRPLGAVLAELSRQSRVPFSYSSSLVPTTRRCQLRPGPARPLAAVLREILAAGHLSYGLVGGQLVLWPDEAGVPADVAAVNGWPGMASQAALASSKYQPPRPVSTARLASRPASPSPALAGGPAPAAASAAPASRKLAPKRPLITAAMPWGAARNPTSFDAGNRPIPVVNRAKSTRNGSRKTIGIAAGQPGRVSDGNRPLAGSIRHQHQNLPADPAVATSALPGSKKLSAKPQRRGAGRALARTQAQSRAIPKPAPPALPAAASEAQTGAAPLPTAATLSKATPDSTASLPLAAAPVPDSASIPSKPLARADSSQQRQTGVAGLLGPRYLHGELSTGETLPGSAVAKVGFQSAYLLVGAALADHQGGGGLGLGTAGRARGRFTPSLDLLYWWLGGGSPRDDRGASSALVQLRPALAWQIKAGQRWQLVGGPTLNLATSHHENQPPRGHLGEGQWLWLDEEHGPDSIRLWPGLQLGLRF